MSVGSCNVCDSVLSLMWSMRLRSQIHSLVASYKAIISASLDKVVVRVCLVLRQDIAVDPYKNKYSVWDFASSGS